MLHFFLIKSQNNTQTFLNVPILTHNITVNLIYTQLGVRKKPKKKTSAIVVKSDSYWSKNITYHSEQVLEKSVQMIIRVLPCDLWSFHSLCSTSLCSLHLADHLVRSPDPSREDNMRLEKSTRVTDDERRVARGRTQPRLIKATRATTLCNGDNEPSRAPRSQNIPRLIWWIWSWVDRVIAQHLPWKKADMENTWGNFSGQTILCGTLPVLIRFRKKNDFGKDGRE